MAEKELENEDGQAEKKSLPSKKGIIIISAVVVLAIALSVAATLFLLGGDEESETVPAEPAAESEEAEVSSGDGHGKESFYLALEPPFVVTFNVAGRQRYMQISMSVASRSQAVLDALTYHMPLIKSKLITAYSQQDFSALQTDAGKQSLQLLTVSVINGVLSGEKAGAIENVYFSNLVLQ